MKHSWREKVDKFCVDCIEAYGGMDLQPLQTGKLSDLSKWMEIWGAWYEALEEGGLIVPRKIRLLVHIHSLVHQAQELLPTLAERGFKFSTEKDARVMVLSIEVRNLVGMLRQMQFGNDALDESQTRALAAQCFEFFAELCRGRIALPKGRINAELVELINLIYEHQKEPLTHGETLQALNEAGITFFQDLGTFRVWLSRARKKGLVSNPFAVEKDPRTLRAAKRPPS